MLTEGTKSVKNGQESGCVNEENLRKTSQKSNTKTNKGNYLEDSELMELKRKLSNPNNDNNI